MGNNEEAEKRRRAEYREKIEARKWLVACRSQPIRYHGSTRIQAARDNEEEEKIEGWVFEKSRRPPATIWLHSVAEGLPENDIRRP
jgi:hypothetical protein